MKKKLIAKYQTSGLIKLDNQKSSNWGNRGKGNELQSAFETGTSYILFTLPEQINNVLSGRGWKTDDEVTLKLGYNPNTHSSNGELILGGIAPQVGGNIQTSKLIKAIPNYTNKTYIGNYSDYTKPLANYLLKLGVDISKFDDYDLAKLILLNRQSFRQDPNIPGRWIAEHSIKLGDKDAYNFILMLGRKLIGDFDVIGSKGNLKAGSIENFNDNVHHKVSEDLYNAAINYGKINGYDGLISGERLLSPEKTYSVWKHYTSKQLLSNRGKHDLKTGETNSGPIYKLLKSSDKKQLPVKSYNIFHPDKVNNNGRFKFPDWKDPSPFKIIIPYAIGQYIYNNETDKGK